MSRGKPFPLVPNVGGGDGGVGGLINWFDVSSGELPGGQYPRVTWRSSNLHSIAIHFATHLTSYVTKKKRCAWSVICSNMLARLLQFFLSPSQCSDRANAHLVLRLNRPEKVMASSMEVLEMELLDTVPFFSAVLHVRDVQHHLVANPHPVHPICLS